MADKKNNSGLWPILEAVGNAVTKENIQTYLLGTKKNGTPRAVYDIIRDYTVEDNRKKTKKKKYDRFSLYLGPSTSDKKKKKKKKKSKHWRY